MVSEDRLIFLLGRHRPARVVPAGLVRDPTEGMADRPHTPLHELDPTPANEHPEATHGHDNHHLLTYPHDPGADGHHQVLVSASSQELLERHLETAAIWIRAAQRGEAEEAHRGPQPIHLFNLVEEAVATVTGASLEKLLDAAGDDRPRDLAALLGKDADAVRETAAGALARGLERLAEDGVLDGGDLDALDPEALIDALLTEPRRVEKKPGAEAIVVTLLHPPGVEHAHFSMKIEG